MWCCTLYEKKGLAACFWVFEGFTEDCIVLEVPIVFPSSCENFANGSDGFRQSHDLLMNAPLGIFQATPKRGLSAVNHAFTRMLGYETAAELCAAVTDIGIQLFESRQEYIEFESLMEKEGVVTNLHRRFLRMDSSVIWVSLTSRVVRGEDGRVQYSECFVSDVTSEVESFSESRKRNRLLADVTREGIVIHKNGVAIDLNNSMARMLGFERKELRGTNFLDFIHEDDRERVLNNIAKEYAPPYEVRIKRKDGLFFWVEIEAENFPMGDDLWRAAAVRDITERRQMEKDLRTKSAELERFFNLSLDLLCIADTSGIFLRLNPEWYRVFGYAETELLGCNFLDFVHPDDIKKTQAAIASLESQQEVSNFENRYRCRDGTYRCIEWRSRPQGDLIYAAARDITERKRAEEALSRSEETFRNIVEASPMGIHIYELHDDDRLVFTSANASADRILRTDSAKYIGLTLEEAFPPLEDTEIPVRYRQAARYGQSWYTEQIDYDHEEIQGAFEAHVFQMSPGKAAVMFSDITQRKRAEEALRCSEERHQMAMLAANDGLWDWDIAADKIFFDSRFYTLAGYEPDEFPCLFKEWSGRVHPDDIERWQAELYSHVRGETTVFDVDFRFLRKDNTWMWLRGRGKGVEYDIQGRLSRMVGTHTSITNRKRAEAERERLQEQLTQAQKMESVGRLAGGVAHDFNNMLSVILGRTEMALVGMESGDPLYATLQEISKAAGRSALLTRQLLAFARKQTVAPRVLDLNTTVAGMLAMLERLIGEDIDLVWIPGKDLPPVKMDSSQIDQILANLCVNSRDAIGDTGKIFIETAAAVLDETSWPAHVDCVPGEYILLIVSDNGCGMDSETMSHLFEPFFTTKETGKGTGLGLATVYGIVKQNKGYIHAYSEPGQGSTFKIYLPVHSLSHDSVVKEEKALQTERGHETVLLVEDEPMILDMTAKMLDLQGYKVLPASTPGEAIRIACEYVGHIDILMTDVVMPEMNGRELARNLLSLFPEMKRLFMSGYTANVIAHHGVLDEGVHFIQKPFAMEELAAKIREILDGQ
ncbi:MAG: PAS domain S-box protein [Desulfopila sp.]|jgi:PAS domain S-box-containing protein|nr:PAS domain S-box protein [Desulfopila sp.]